MSSNKPIVMVTKAVDTTTISSLIDSTKGILDVNCINRIDEHIRDNKLKRGHMRLNITIEEYKI